MNEIKQFIKNNFHIIKKKFNKIKTEGDAYNILLKISLFHTKIQPKILDWKRYIQTYPDLKKHLKNSKDVSWHYLNHGIEEMRKVYVLNSNEVYQYEFNWKTYVDLNDDLKILTNEIDAFQHYIEKGYFENRKTTFFETTIVNDRIKITNNDSVNKQWLKLLQTILSNTPLSSLIPKTIEKKEETPKIEKKEETPKIEKKEETPKIEKKFNGNILQLIYWGVLCDENNILEIIEEFIKIHANNPNILLLIVYDEIINTNDGKKLGSQLSSTLTVYAWLAFPG